MSKEREYISIGKMAHVPVECKDRDWGWFYHRCGIGRLMEDHLPFDTYQRAIPDFAGYHLCDKCHAVMCIEEGIIPREAGIQLLKGLRAMEAEGIDAARRKAGGVGHSGEAYLIQKLGWDVGGYINVGRSSHDLMWTQHRVLQRDALLDVMDGVNDLRETLLDLSEKHVESIMPEYTALQHARPMSLGFFLVSFVKMLERDFDRLELCYKHTNISPIGIAEGTGSDFPLNPQRTAELGGFDEVFDNACDMWEAYDSRAEAFAVLGTIGDVLGRIGTHLMRWCTYEFGTAELADRYCGTSSIMSQKKNPGASALVNAGITARNMSLLDEGRRLEAGGGDDGYFEQAVRNIMNGLRYARGILETTKFNTDRMRELCDHGFMCNADLCRILVQEKGLPWRTAHQITAIMTRKTRERGWEMADVTSEFLDECAQEYVDYGSPLNLSQEKIREAFNPENSLNSLRSPGAAAPERVMEQIDKSREELKRDRASAKEKRDRLKAAADKLERAIDALTEAS